MIKDTRVIAANSARKKHHEAVNDIRFTDGQLSYNPTVIKAGRLYDYYSATGNTAVAKRIMELLDKTIKHLRGIDMFSDSFYAGSYEPSTPQVTYAYILAESGSFLITEDNNAIIQ